MRWPAAGIAVFAAVALGAAGHAAPAAFTVPCDEIIGSTTSGTADGYRVVLGRVAVPPGRLQRAVASVEPRWPYWSKAGLIVRAGRTAVTVAVPRAWRRREAITWGNGRPAVSTLRIAACRPSPHAWNGYAGGFFTRARRACVPLTVHVGPRARTVWIGIGRRCRSRT